jgi:ankyrin repeat protein
MAAKEDPLLMSLIRAIVRGDATEASEILGATPTLARQSISVGATRQEPKSFFFPEIMHYFYAGDTALHAAAVRYHVGIAAELVTRNAEIAARNRRGAEPLHYAADGGPRSPTWNPKAQAEMIAFLIQTGADPNALDKSGVAPLHRAVRGRCPSAVSALLAGGADVELKNKSGSTPLHLARVNSGRGGTGSPESKACQQEIVEILLAAGAKLN